MSAGAGFYKSKTYRFFQKDEEAWLKKAYEEVHTKSGLKVLFLKDKEFPYIQYSMLFPGAGADYDPEDQSGLALMTASLAEQGAGGLDSEALQARLNELGTQLDISVDRQRLFFKLRGLSWYGEELWSLFQKVIAEPHFHEKEMEILRSQLLERRSRALDQPSAVASMEWQEMAFPGSIGKDEGGDMISLSKISLEDIKNFYRDYYLKGRPILMVTGQYDDQLKQKIISFVENYFSSPSSSSGSFSVSQSSPEFKLLTNKELLQAEVVIGYPLDSFPVDNPRKALVLRLANMILGGGGMTTRLFVELRDKRGLTYGTYSQISLGKYYGMFSVEGHTKTESIKEFLDQTLNVMQTFRSEGVSAEELSRAKQGMRSQHLKNIEAPEKWLGHRVYYNDYLKVSPDFINNFLKILDSISLDEVNQSISDFVLSRPLKILVYGHPSIEDRLKDLKGYPPLKAVSFKDQFARELEFRKIK